MQTRLQAPVVLIIFNRPDPTSRVLDAIASVKPRRLFVVADGPRADHPEDERLVAETRALIDRVDWAAEVMTCYSDVNLGCTRRISSGLNWVFEQTPRAIILEDDCLPDPSFFPYCEELLQRYEDATDVQMISGTNAVGARGLYSYHFSRTFNIWGWATWARSWRDYDEDMRPWLELRETDWLERLLQDEKGARVARVLLDETSEGRKPWDFHWTFRGWMRGAVSITPSVNLVSNIGFGAGATHQRDASHPQATRPLGSMSFPMTHPPGIEVLKEADRAIWAAMHPRFFPAEARPWTALRNRMRRSAVKAEAEKPGRGPVVIGSAVGLAVEQVLPFINSLRNCGYAGDLVLFVDRRLRRHLHRHALPPSVRLMPARALLPFNFPRVRRSRLLWPLWLGLHTVGWGVLKELRRLPDGLRGGLNLQRSLAQFICTPMEARFLSFQKFLEGHTYSRVLLTDTRDVLFQSDPFAQLTTTGLAVSVESRNYTIATERHNREWIEGVYGEDVLDRIGSNPPSCVGVTYGGRAAISSYLDRMVAEILSLRGRAASQGGADTAIHNYLLWTGQLGSVQLLETLGTASAVATLNEVPPEDLALDAEGRLLNRDGSMPSVVHQYDRQPKVAQALLATLAD